MFFYIAGVKPSLSELEKFEEAPEGIDIELPTTNTLKDDSTSHSFSTGDNVIVCEGELKHLQGKIISIDGNLIMVQPKHEVLKVKKNTEKEINLEKRWK